MLNWESLQTACLSCTSCPLSQTRHNVVFGARIRGIWPSCWHGM